MKSTYKITITYSDSHGRFNVYEDSTVADMVQLLIYIARLNKSEWDVSIKKVIDCPYQVNIGIDCKSKTNWAQYTIRIEDGEANGWRCER